MNRYEVAKNLLEKRKFFKLVCGAGNEDAEEVKKLVYIYTLSGAKCFDVSCNVDVVKSAGEAIDMAIKHAPSLGREIVTRPFINVSIGMKGDPHVRKAKMNDKCTKCGECKNVCPTNAITEKQEIIETKCIGCGNCESVCLVGAIEFFHKDNAVKSLLTECKKCGAEQMELHAAVPNDTAILEEWKMLKEIIPDNYISMCLDRLHLGDSELKRRIIKAKEIAGEKFIVQADGVPMSGGKDDFNTTLQAVAIADIVMKSKIKVMVLLSGGTNSKTSELADACDVTFNGVSIGTFARNLVKDIISDNNFWQDENKIKEAVTIADNLIQESIGEVVW